MAKKNEIKVGQVWSARVSGKRVQCEVLSEDSKDGEWRLRNTTTGKVVVRSYRALKAVAAKPSLPPLKFADVAEAADAATTAGFQALQEANGASGPTQEPKPEAADWLALANATMATAEPFCDDLPAEPASLGRSVSEAAEAAKAAKAASTKSRIAYDVPAGGRAMILGAKAVHVDGTSMSGLAATLYADGTMLLDGTTCSSPRAAVMLACDPKKTSSKWNQAGQTWWVTADTGAQLRTLRQGYVAPTRKARAGGSRSRQTPLEKAQAAVVAAKAKLAKLAAQASAQEVRVAEANALVLELEVAVAVEATAQPA